MKYPYKLHLRYIFFNAIASAKEHRNQPYVRIAVLILNQMIRMRELNPENERYRVKQSEKKT